MKAVKVFGLGDLCVVEVPDPVPGRGEVLLAVRACGICGSDKWYWRTSTPTDYVAGHEVAGEVLAVGPEVHRLRVGDRVAVNNVRGCGECAACRAGHYVRCAVKVEHMGGGFAELMVAPERNCLELHPAVGDEAGCLIFDMWGTPYAAVTRAGVDDSTTVVIFGGGPLGLAALVLARRRGAYVIVVEPLAYRREAAERYGAAAALPPTEAAVSEIRRLTGGVDLVLECSGSGEAYQLGFQALRFGGTLAAIGEGARFGFDVSAMFIHRGLNMFGSFYSTIQQGREVQDLMTQGQIEPLSLVTHRFGLTDLPREFGRVVECAEGVLKALVLPG